MCREKKLFCSMSRCLLSGLLLTLCLAIPAWATAPDYSGAVKLGSAAGDQAKKLLGVDSSKSKLIALTNAGYAMPEGRSTQGCLDGLSAATGATTGASTLITLQRRFDQPLWFAIFAPESGKCAYFEYEAESTAKALASENPAAAKRVKTDVARIDAEHLCATAEEFNAKAQKGLFGKNAFRIITTANAAARNCGDDVLKAIQVHDHFCPGVTSGIVLADYIRHNIMTNTDAGSKCFILSLNPWCKEDALTTLLNATPGKRSYAVLYPTDEQRAAWPEHLNKTCSIVFTKNKDANWHGYMLGFDFNEAKAAYGAKDFGNTILNKLYADIWFLDHMENAQKLVKLHKEFELKNGISPRDLMQPQNNIISTLATM